MQRVDYSRTKPRNSKVPLNLENRAIKFVSYEEQLNSFAFDVIDHFSLDKDNGPVASDTGF